MNLKNITLLCVLAVSLVVASTTTVMSANAPNNWQHWNSITIMEAIQKIPGFTMSITPSDMLIDFWANAEQKEKLGTLVLTQNRFFAVKGIEVEANSNTTLLSSTMLDYFFVVTLLTKAIPNGPNSVDKAQDFSVVETTHPLRIAAPGVQISYLCPWQASIHIQPASSKNSFSYSIEFSANSKEEQIKRSISGQIKFNTDLNNNLPESMSLAGWSTFKIDRVQTVHLGRASTEYWAKNLPSVKNLGELRTYANR